MLSKEFLGCKIISEARQRKQYFVMYVYVKFNLIKLKFFN